MIILMISKSCRHALCAVIRLVKIAQLQYPVALVFLMLTMPFTSQPMNPSDVLEVFLDLATIATAKGDWIGQINND